MRQCCVLVSRGHSEGDCLSRNLVSPLLEMVSTSIVMKHLLRARRLANIDNILEGKNVKSRSVKHDNLSPFPRGKSHT